MRALIVVDAQNEFSPGGLRPVHGHAAAIAAIQRRVEHARASGDLIAWIRHYNKPHETPAFVPGTWGSEISPELVPHLERRQERLFEKEVYGAFTTTELEAWLRSRDVARVIIVGFFTHGCVSTSAREALVRGFYVAVDPDGTATRAISHPLLGSLTAEEVRRGALLELAEMGVTIEPLSDAAHGAVAAAMQPALAR